MSSIASRELPTLRRQRGSLPTRAALALLWAYKVVSANRSPACRFIPSCSEYAAIAVRRFGLRSALPLVVRRLARCRPGGPFGLDPVPDVLVERAPRRRGWGPRTGEEPGRGEPGRGRAPRRRGWGEAP